MNADKLQRLNDAIREVITDIEGPQPLFKDETRTWMVEVLADSVIRRAAKFARGQAEHGGDFLTNKMNVIGMMEEEIDDHFFYFERFKADVAKSIARMNRTNPTTTNK